jgi:hypothetical protein
MLQEELISPGKLMEIKRFFKTSVRILAVG